MTPPDEAPEQRWRRTVERRNRPAKLKVDRLLRDFGYAELDAEVGDAIEARLAGVSLAVTPSLRAAAAGEVVTIYAKSAATGESATAAEPVAAEPVTPEEPAVASDVAQMVSYLKQQVLDAREEAERLRTELDRRIAARMDAERDNEAIIAEQAAALEAQGRQVAELAAALDSTRQALAETRDEIRRAVGELQALPEPVPADVEPLLLAADEEATAADDATDDFGAGVGGEPWADGREDAGVGALLAAPVGDEGAADFAPPPSDPAGAAEDDDPVEPEPELETALDLDEPVLRMTEEPEPEFDLDEPALGTLEETPADRAQTELDRGEPADVGESPAPQTDEFEIEPLPRAETTPERDEVGDWQPEIPPEPHEPETRLHTVGDPEEPVTVPPGQPEPADDLDSPLPLADEWLPADLRPPPDGAAPAPGPLPIGAGEPEAELTDFDDFLYEAEELYDPGEPDGAAGGDALLESEIEARWPDEPAAALPPPPPAPPSPFADELAPEPPAVAQRATRGKAPRGRGGRGRWEGSCSICGREPQVNRRKDLQAAGWDLDDDAAACPQCRGVG